MNEDRIAGSAREFAGKTEAAIGDVTGNVAMQAAGHARGGIGTAQNIYGQAKDAYDHGGDTFRDGSQALAQKVKEKPLGSLVIACAVGFALGLLMTRPPRRRQRGWRYYR
jgi:uncharacterized protein YjbJ (UPF0337 family)